MAAVKRDESILDGVEDRMSQRMFGDFGVDTSKILPVSRLEQYFKDFLV